MSITAAIRIATEDDAAAIREIYAPHVEQSAVSFETQLPSVDEMARRIRTMVPLRPWLVYIVYGRVAGYAYASSHRERAAYRWSTEVTAYVHPDFHGRGIGKRLYAALCTLLHAQGYVNAFGIITLPNVASVALHESCGFRRCATYLHAGYKFDRWHDVGWWQLALQTPGARPNEPIAFADLNLDSLLASKKRLSTV
jgi:L-amino acid N-acyltransferase YncA